MKTLLIWVTSWRRPKHLKDTLDSIAVWADVPHDIAVVDNESSTETAAIIREHPAISFNFLLPKNMGINWPIENLMPTVLNHRYIMICDQDLHFSRPFGLYTDLLENFQNIGVAKGLDGPEHPASGTLTHRGENWIIKDTERGGGIVVEASWLLRSFPLPKSNIDFDVHTMKHLNGRKIAVLPRACVHTGWRRGESTWQDIEIPERYVLEDGAVVLRETLS